MTLIRTGSIHVRGLKHMVQIINTDVNKRIQVFVYSYRSGKWYPQANPFNITELPLTDPMCEVVLGDTAHKTGRYDVRAVALDGPAVWGPQDALPSGEASNELYFHRRGL